VIIPSMFCLVQLYFVYVYMHGSVYVTVALEPYQHQTAQPAACFILAPGAPSVVFHPYRARL